MRAIVAFVALCLVMAGCASEADAASQDARPRLDDQPLTSDAGAIEGTVVDDQITPLSDAVVGVKETGASATTDAGGAFRIGGLPTGTYTLFAQKLGYEAAAKSVQVVAGEALKIQFTLTPLSTAVPYPLTQEWTGLIECAWGVSGAGSGNCLPLQFVFQQIGTNPTNTRIIGLFPVTEPEKVAQGIFEMTWNPSAATTGGQLLLTVELEGTGVVTGRTYGREQGASPVRVVTDEAPFKELKPAEKKDKVQTRTFPATTNPPTVVVNQKFTVYATACYLGDCPDGFTALSDA